LDIAIDSRDRIIPYSVIRYVFAAERLSPISWRRGYLWGIYSRKRWYFSDIDDLQRRWTSQDTG